MSDFLTQKHDEIKARIAELKPMHEEYELLVKAEKALRNNRASWGKNLEKPKTALRNNRDDEPEPKPRRASTKKTR